MAEVVGTAFVQIRALTNNLAKDIEKSVKKGMKDANLEKIAQTEGDDFGEEFGDRFSETANKTIKKNSKDIIPTDDLFGGLDKPLREVREKFQQLSFDDAFDGIEERFDQLSFDFDFPEIDVDPIHEAFEEIREDHDRTQDDFNRSSLGKSLDKLTAKFKTLGSTGSGGLTLLRGSLLLVGGAVVAALPIIQDVGSAILAYVTGLAAQIGFVGTALGGVSVAAIAAIGSAATAALPIVLAFKAETEFLLDFQDSMKAAGEEFLRIGVATQRTLLPALDEAVFVLGDLIPMFSEFGFFVGRAVGDFALLAAEVLVGNEAQGRFQAILQSSLRILDILLPTLINVGDILSGIWVAAIPASERFVAAVGNLVERWSDMVNQGLATGELVDTFDTWFDRAQLLGSALGNLTGALLDIFSVGADSADDLFVRFDEWAQRFRDFTESESGQNRLKLIFDNSLAVMREINAIAAELFDGIFGRLGEIGGVDSMVAALQRFRDVLPGIQEQFQEILGTIERVTRIIATNAFDKLTHAFEELSEPLGRLAFQFLDLLQVMDDSGAFEIFIDLMEILTNTLSTLLAIPGFGQFIAYFIAFNTATKVASIALGPFLRLFGGFGAAVLNLVRMRAGLELAGAAGGLSKLVAGFKAAAGARGFLTVTQGLQTGARAAGGFAGALGGAAGALSAGGPLLVGLGVAGGALAVGGFAFFRHQQKVQQWRQEIRQATEALGLLNGGLNITADGIAKYIQETSRFETKDQIDDLARLGITVSQLGEDVSKGTLSFIEFTDKAIAAGEVEFRSLTGPDLNIQAKSLKELGDQFELTNEQLNELARGGEIYVKGSKIALEGNDSLIESFVELNEVIGAAAKDNIDAFVLNAQNIRLLGAGALADINKEIKDAEDENAASIMASAQNDLAEAAKKSSESFKGLSDATRDQIKEQATLADGTIDLVKQEQLLFDASQKQNKQIRENLEIFAGFSGDIQFVNARDAVLDFIEVTSKIDVSRFINTTSVDNLIKKFPEAANVANNLFTTLQGLPEAEFNAAATAMGVDADNLKEAMNGAQQSIIDLQNQAIESLPSIGELLDKATTTDEDGTQAFDKRGFQKAIEDRIKQTTDFGDNIDRIKQQLGDEAARLAIQEGPEAAANLASIVGGDAKTLSATLTKMEEAETRLRQQIEDNLGPGIRLEFAQQAGLFGGDFGKSLASGLNSDTTVEAIKGASLSVLDDLARGFQGHFEFDENGQLRFVHTGKFRSTKRRSRFKDSQLLSTGGYVGNTYGNLFAGGPSGTDTVPAWLTPGEFVLRRAVAQAIPAGVLNSLNAGDPRIVGLLTSINKNRPGTSAAQGIVGTTVAGQAAGGGFVIQQMNIQAPSPLESSRMVSDRLRILNSQLTRK